MTAFRGSSRRLQTMDSSELTLVIVLPILFVLFAGVICALWRYRTNHATMEGDHKDEVDDDESGSIKYNASVEQSESSLTRRNEETSRSLFPSDSESLRSPLWPPPASRATSPAPLTPTKQLSIMSPGRPVLNRAVTIKELSSRIDDDELTVIKHNILETRPEVVEEAKRLQRQKSQIQQRLNREPTVVFAPISGVAPMSPRRIRAADPPSPSRSSSLLALLGAGSRSQQEEEKKRKEDLDALAEGLRSLNMALFDHPADSHLSPSRSKGAAVATAAAPYGSPKKPTPSSSSPRELTRSLSLFASEPAKNTSASPLGRLLSSSFGLGGSFSPRGQTSFDEGADSDEDKEEDKEEEEEEYNADEKDLLACTPAELVDRIDRIRAAIGAARQAAGVRERLPRPPADIEDSIFMIRSTATLIGEEELKERRGRINRQRMPKTQKYAKLAALELETFGSIEGKELRRLRLFAIKLLHVQRMVEEDPAWDGGAAYQRVAVSGGGGLSGDVQQREAMMIARQQMQAALNPSSPQSASSGGSRTGASSPAGSPLAASASSSPSRPLEAEPPSGGDTPPPPPPPPPLAVLHSVASDRSSGSSSPDTSETDTCSSSNSSSNSSQAASSSNSPVAFLDAAGATDLFSAVEDEEVRPDLGRVEIGPGRSDSFDEFERHGKVAVDRAERGSPGESASLVAESSTIKAADIAKTDPPNGTRPEDSKVSVAALAIAALDASDSDSPGDSDSDESYEAFKSAGVAGLMTLGSAVSRSSSGGHLDMARVSFESRLSFDAFQSSPASAADGGSLRRMYSSGVYSADSLDGNGDAQVATQPDAPRNSLGGGRYPSARRSSHLIVPENVVSVNAPITRREDLSVFANGKYVAGTNTSKPEREDALDSDIYYTL
jgi:hypothetical protein